MKNLNKHKLVSYTEAFLSFLFSDEKLWKSELIKQILLFGSTARDEAMEDSDVDLFLEVNSAEKSSFVKERAEHALVEFQASRLAKEWGLRGVSNVIRFHVGTLHRMSALKRSLISDGIVLYSKYSPKEGVKGTHHLLISFDPIKEKAKKYRIDRYLFGRHEAKISTEGTVKKLGGRKINTRSFVLPVKEAVEVIKRLKAEKIDFSMYEIWSDSL